MSEILDGQIVGSYADIPNPSRVALEDLEMAILSQQRILKSSNTTITNFIDINTGEFTITATGTQHNVFFNNARLVILNNAADLTITGLQAGSAGQLVRFVSTGAGDVYFKHQNTGSNPENRLRNTVTSGSTPLSGGTGVAEFYYSATLERWLLSNHEQGDWTLYAFASGDFTASGSMGWSASGSGSNTSINYKIRNKEMLLVFGTFAGTLTGTPSNELRWTLPGGYTIDPAFTANQNAQMCRTANIGGDASGTSFMRISAGATYISFYLAGAVNWNVASSSGQTSVFGSWAIGLT